MKEFATQFFEHLILFSGVIRRRQSDIGISKPIINRMLRNILIGIIAPILLGIGSTFLTLMLHDQMAQDNIERNARTIAQLDIYNKIQDDDRKQIKEDIRSIRDDITRRLIPMQQQIQAISTMTSTLVAQPGVK